MRFAKVESGEWVQPRRRNYYMKCCDCGLSHRLNFRVIKTRSGACFIQFQAFRVEKRKHRLAKAARGK